MFTISLLYITPITLYVTNSICKLDTISIHDLFNQIVNGLA